MVTLGPECGDRGVAGEQRRAGQVQNALQVRDRGGLDDAGILVRFSRIAKMFAG